MQDIALILPVAQNTL